VIVTSGPGGAPSLALTLRHDSDPSRHSSQLTCVVRIRATYQGSIMMRSPE
jgi:hypothetical protein